MLLYRDVHAGYNGPIKSTNEEILMTIIAKLRNSMSRRIDNAMLEYNTFQERFAESPADAMIWSDSLFNAAARS